MNKEDQIRMQYIGALVLLGRCNLYAPEEERDCILNAIEDGCSVIPNLTYKKTLDLIELEIQYDMDIDE